MIPLKWEYGKRFFCTLYTANLEIGYRCDVDRVYAERGTRASGGGCVARGIIFSTNRIPLRGEEESGSGKSGYYLLMMSSNLIFF